MFGTYVLLNICTKFYFCVYVLAMLFACVQTEKASYMQISSLLRRCWFHKDVSGKRSDLKYNNPLPVQRDRERERHASEKPEARLVGTWIIQEREARL